MTGNTDIITNSVIILFICDLDELFYGILVIVAPRWVKSMTNESDDDSDSVEALQRGLNANANAKLEQKVANLEEEVRMLSQNIKLLLKQSPELVGVVAKDKEKDEFARFLALGWGVNLP